MSIFKRNTLIGLTASAALLLSACEGVGKGSKPESLRVLPLDGNTQRLLLNASETPQPAKAFTCFRSGLGLYVTFSDGTIGTFSNRATWDSSDDDILRVASLGDAPDADGLVFSPGVLTPVAAGTATVTATYLGMRASIPVTVTETNPASFSITPKTAVMAPSSFQVFRVAAMVNGIMTDVSNSGTFSFVTPDSDVAILGSNGTVSAVEAGDPMTLQMKFTPDCPVTPAARIQVAEPTSLRIEREPGFYPVDAAPTENLLVAGYTQYLRVVAGFGDIDLDPAVSPEEQDVSGQVATLLCAQASTETGTCNPATAVTPIRFGSALNLRANEVTGQAAGSVNITANYARTGNGVDEMIGTADDVYRVSSAKFPLRVVVGQAIPPQTPPVATDPLNEEPLQDITLGPVGAGITEPCGTAQLKATGQFDLDGDDPTLFHDVSRHVIWTINDAALPSPVVFADLCNPASPALALVNNFPASLTPGLVGSQLSATAAARTVQVQALRVRGVRDTTPVTPGDLLPDLTRTLPLEINRAPAP